VRVSAGDRPGREASSRDARILRVDLSDGVLEETRVDEATWRTYAGGSLLATRLLITETRPGLDPLEPDAPLVVASSIVAGRRAAGLPRFTAAAKSPLTGGIGEARAEGPFGVALGASGFDAIVITGRGDRPVVLVIVDGRPRLIDAAELWGLDTSAVVEALESRLGPCSVAAIGPAGERLVRFASIVTDRSFALARTGLGAVMGAKRLKAIAIAGEGDPVPVIDVDALDAITREYASRLESNPVTRWQLHPPGFGAWVGSAAIGSFGVRNYTTSAFPKASGYQAQAFLDRLAWSEGGCPGCPSDCIKGFAPSTDPGDLERTRERRAGGLHQEAVAALGPNLGLANAGDALRLNDLASRLGLDPVSLGFTLSFAMECRDRALVSPADVDGTGSDDDLRFGNAGAALRMTEQITRREGAGDWLAEGSYRAAVWLDGEAAGSSGGGAIALALQVKGLEVTPFDPRAQAGLALGFATAPFGPRYDVAEHDADFDDRAPAWPHALEASRPLGIDSLLPATAQTPEKARAYAALAEFWSALDALDVCPFASIPVRILSLDDVAAICRAVTGWDVDTAEVMGWGARRLQLMRVYNLREGLTAADDRLPDRFFDEPIDAGPLAGSRLDRDAFAGMIATYYEHMGWDRDGVPTAATLATHGLDWTAGATGLAERGLAGGPA
jgi:aldehyde:ferredoxin oxidoreductase